MSDTAYAVYALWCNTQRLNPRGVHPHAVYGLTVHCWPAEMFVLLGRVGCPFPHWMCCNPHKKHYELFCQFTGKIKSRWRSILEKTSEIVCDVCLHDAVTKWKHFPRYWPFVRGIHRSSVYSPHKSQWRRALMFSSICAWMNAWVNNSEADDLRRHCAHYGIAVMCDLYLFMSW